MVLVWNRHDARVILLQQLDKSILQRVRRDFGISVDPGIIVATTKSHHEDEELPTLNILDVENGPKYLKRKAYNGERHSSRNRGKTNYYLHYGHEIEGFQFRFYQN
jgi:hypothetical protein